MRLPAVLMFVFYLALAVLCLSPGKVFPAVLAAPFLAAAVLCWVEGFGDDGVTD